jgi:hypothetical protein
MKVRLVTAGFFHADGKTDACRDRHNKAKSHYFKRPDILKITKFHTPYPSSESVYGNTHTLWYITRVITDCPYVHTPLFFQMCSCASSIVIISQTVQNGN